METKSIDNEIMEGIETDSVTISEYPALQWWGKDRKMTYNSNEVMRVPEKLQKILCLPSTNIPLTSENYLNKKNLLISVTDYVNKHTPVSAEKQYIRGITNLYNSLGKAVRKKEIRDIITMDNMPAILDALYAEENITEELFIPNRIAHKSGYDNDDENRKTLVKKDNSDEFDKFYYGNDCNDDLKTQNINTSPEHFKCDGDNVIDKSYYDNTSKQTSITKPRFKNKMARTKKKDLHNPVSHTINNEEIHDINCRCIACGGNTMVSVHSNNCSCNDCILK